MSARPRHTSALERMSNLHPDVLVGCMCPHCGAVFIPWELEGDVGNRRCPKCHTQVLPTDYDEKAKGLLAAREQFKAQINEALPAYERAQKIMSLFNFFLLKPFRKLAKKFFYAPIYKYASLQDQRMSNDRKLIFAAKDRYYVSEFFQLTHIPLKRQDAEGEVTIQPFYDKFGEWIIPFGPAYNQGLIAEMQVFEVLLHETQDPMSELYGARLAPNLYFPRHTQNASVPDRFWDQVDIIVFTKKAAFVLEVKGHRISIVANAPFTTIYSSKTKSSDEFSIQDTGETGAWDARETAALTQNSSHAVSFKRLCTSYPYSSIFEQVVFVHPVSAKSNSKRFIGNVNVSFLKSDGSAFFLTPIKGMLTRLKDKLTDDELEDLADSFIEKYGDLTHTRANMHVERIKKLKNMQE